MTNNKKVGLTGKILLAVLIISFVSMVAYLLDRFGMQDSQLLAYAIFGVTLVVVAWSSLASGKLQGIAHEDLDSSTKYIMASFALSLSTLILVLVISLPFVGFRAFEMMDGFWFPLALVVLATLFYPVSKRYIK